MHFHRHVEHLNNENIKKTYNKVENYYGQTNSKKNKEIIQNQKEILTFLDFQMQHWTQNHIKIK